MVHHPVELRIVLFQPLKSIQNSIANSVITNNSLKNLCYIYLLEIVFILQLKRDAMFFVETSIIMPSRLFAKSGINS